MTQPITKVKICGVWDATHSPAVPDLAGDVVHVWQRPLDESTALETCYQLLSLEERKKASHYRVERPRRQFILTRGTLRSLLGAYLEKLPTAVSFQYTEFGKPLLQDTDDLHFNVSHTDGMALLAFVRRHGIGVDVEKLSAARDVKQLAQRFFSPREWDSLKGLSGIELQAAFFRCWTRKEAYIKAIGEGLSLPLNQFDVSIRPNDANALLATRPDPTEALRWMLSDVSFHPEYAAAIAVGGNAGR